jgi:hypothetical protein
LKFVREKGPADAGLFLLAARPCAVFQKFMAFFSRYLVYRELPEKQVLRLG